jgi:hypothetical protein
MQHLGTPALHVVHATYEQEEPMPDADGCAPLCTLVMTAAPPRRDAGGANARAAAAALLKRSAEAGYAPASAFAAAAGDGLRGAAALMGPLTEQLAGMARGGNVHTAVSQRIVPRARGISSRARKANAAAMQHVFEASVRETNEAAGEELFS